MPPTWGSLLLRPNEASEPPPSPDSSGDRFRSGRELPHSLPPCKQAPRQSRPHLQCALQDRPPGLHVHLEPECRHQHAKESSGSAMPPLWIRDTQAQLPSASCSFASRASRSTPLAGSTRGHCAPGRDQTGNEKDSRETCVRPGIVSSVQWVAYLVARGFSIAQHGLAQSPQPGHRHNESISPKPAAATWTPGPHDD